MSLFDIIINKMYNNRKISKTVSHNKYSRIQESPELVYN